MCTKSLVIHSNEATTNSYEILIFQEKFESYALYCNLHFRNEYPITATSNIHVEYYMYHTHAVWETLAYSIYSHVEELSMYKQQKDEM